MMRANESGSTSGTGRFSLSRCPRLANVRPIKAFSPERPSGAASSDSLSLREKKFENMSRLLLTNIVAS